MSKRGLFITLEGGEGAGKSTAMSFLERELGDAGIDLVCTREPGGTRLGEKLREALLTPEDYPVDATAELLMIFAARSQHLQELIIPSLQAGRWVLCDRFTDASYAYQGEGRGLGAAPIALLEDLVQGSLRPDVTLLMDVSAETGLERARGRGALDRFEQEDLAFFERVREAYRSRAASGSGRYQVIDAGADLDTVRDSLAVVVRELLACPPVFEDA